MQIWNDLNIFFLKFEVFSADFGNKWSRKKYRTLF